ncbi:MAG: hypothetical protein LJE87_11595 [Deltaproteobacteria bacterium]|jgi:hypothetical protein|nr:hypothetical protein [Deltaproteobacteria bacterium]
MAFRTNSLLVSIIVLANVLLSGCVTYQISKYVEGDVVNVPNEELEVGKTTLEEALSILGAPDKVAKVGVENLLLYERELLYRNRIKVGIPLSEIIRGNLSASAYGTLVRYDSLALFFNTEDILSHKTFAEGSSYPYLRTLFSAQQ